jgi:preprotein translocase subunit SecY
MNPAAAKEFFSQGVFGFINLISGGALANTSILALGVAPYITSEIIVQLLTVVIPAWERMAKEEAGRKQLAQYGRYGTVILAFVQGYATSAGLASQGVVTNRVWWNYLLLALIMTAGATFVMWLGELITEKGIGNGISLMIFASIVSRLPVEAINLVNYAIAGTVNIILMVALLIVTLVVIAAVVWVEQGERRIPVQYAKRVVGHRMYGGQSTHLPLKVNQAGVLPIIFASSMLAFPQVIAQFSSAAWAQAIARFFASGSVTHTVLYILLIVGFTYFYTLIQFNPFDIADNLRKNGGFVPGLRPGKPTSDYLGQIVSRLTAVTAVWLVIIVVLPLILSTIFKINIGLGGTTLLIVIGVAIETVKQIEAQLMVRHYSGFLK